MFVVIAGSGWVKSYLAPAYCICTCSSTLPVLVGAKYMPVQLPGVGDDASEVSRMGKSTVPVAEITPSMRKPVLGRNRTSTPCSIVSVAPLATLIGQVTIKGVAPKPQVVSALIVPQTLVGPVLVAVGVGILVAVLVGVKVGVAVSVAVDVGVSDGIAVAVGVGDSVEILVGVAVSVEVGIAVGVAVSSTPGVSVGVLVCVLSTVGVVVDSVSVVLDGIGVSVNVAVAVGAGSCVTVGVAESTGVGVAPGVGRTCSMTIRPIMPGLFFRSWVNSPGVLNCCCNVCPGGIVPENGPRTPIFAS